VKRWLEDIAMKAGFDHKYAIDCTADCASCPLTGFSVWGTSYKDNDYTDCASKLKAWQEGKLAYIDNEWYEVEQ
jgi:hypothetical protein